MSSGPLRRYVLATVLIGLLVAAALLRRAVIETAFFAVTVAYVLYPARSHLRDSGLSLGAIGFIAGPLIVGLVVEAVALLSERRAVEGPTR